MSQPVDRRKLLKRSNSSMNLRRQLVDNLSFVPPSSSNVDVKQYIHLVRTTFYGAVSLYQKREYNRAYIDFNRFQALVEENFPDTSNFGVGITPEEKEWLVEAKTSALLFLEECTHHLDMQEDQRLAENLEAQMLKEADRQSSASKSNGQGSQIDASDYADSWDDDDLPLQFRIAAGIASAKESQNSSSSNNNSDPPNPPKIPLGKGIPPIVTKPPAFDGSNSTGSHGSSSTTPRKEFIAGTSSSSGSNPRDTPTSTRNPPTPPPSEKSLQRKHQHVDKGSNDSSDATLQSIKYPHLLQQDQHGDGYIDPQVELELALMGFEYGDIIKAQQEEDLNSVPSEGDSARTRDGSVNTSKAPSPTSAVSPTVSPTTAAATANGTGVNKEQSKRSPRLSLTRAAASLKKGVSNFAKAAAAGVSSNPSTPSSTPKAAASAATVPPKSKLTQSQRDLVKQHLSTVPGLSKDAISILRYIPDYKRFSICPPSTTVLQLPLGSSSGKSPGSSTPSSNSSNGRSKIATYYFYRDDFHVSFHNFLRVLPPELLVTSTAAETNRCFFVHLGVATNIHPFALQAAFRYFAATARNLEDWQRDIISTVQGHAGFVDANVLCFIWPQEFNKYRICVISGPNMSEAIFSFFVPAEPTVPEDDLVDIVLRCDKEHFTLLRPYTNHERKGRFRILSELKRAAKKAGNLVMVNRVSTSQGGRSINHAIEEALK